MNDTETVLLYKWGVVATICVALAIFGIMGSCRMEDREAHNRRIAVVEACGKDPRPANCLVVVEIAKECSSTAYDADDFRKCVNETKLLDRASLR